MRPSDVFVPIKHILAACWFVVLCMMAPTVAVIILLGATGWVAYDAVKGEKSYKDAKGRKEDGKSDSSKRPEYPY